MNVIEIRDLNKSYGKLKALDGITLDIPRGKIIGLLGKNGAGKSTLMRCLLGFLKYEGSIKTFGKNLPETTLHQRIAFIPDVGCLDERLTVEQTIAYVAGVNESWVPETANRLLQKSQLPLKKRVGKLSKGMKTKLYLMLTLSLDADILLLDEPTLGLDIVFRKEFFNTILGEFYNEDKTIIISTHQVEEVEHILQEIIFIDEGKIVLYEEIEQLKQKYKIVALPSERAEELKKIAVGATTEFLGRISAIVPAEVEIAEAETAAPNLSDLFLMKVGGEK
ncbi:MAG: ABC transporter ATP-binding protein [Candidatus Cloacimonadales bacterium]